MQAIDPTTQQGIEAVRLGDVVHARALLRQAVAREPRNEAAWLWLSTVAENTEQQLDCLRSVLKINPYNHAARRDLAALPARFRFDIPDPNAPGIPAQGGALPSRPVQQTAGSYTAASGSTAARALRNETTVAHTGTNTQAARAAVQSRTMSSLPGAAPVIPYAVPAIVVPDPQLGASEQPRDPDYVPIGGAAAPVAAHTYVPSSTSTPNGSYVPYGSYAPGGVQSPGDPQLQVGTAPGAVPAPGAAPRRGIGATYLSRIALGLSLVSVLGMLALALLIDRSHPSAAGSLQQPAVAGAQTAVPTVDTSAQALTRKIGPTTSIVTAHGPLVVPGTGFIDGRMLASSAPKALEVVSLWDEPFDTGHMRCKLAHGTAVLLLELHTSANGSQAIRIQHRDCSGWLSADLLSSTAPAESAPVTNDFWKPGK